MYTISSLKRVLREPQLIVDEINRLFEQNFKITRQPDHNPNGIDLFSQDWDMLILLDACRFDVFQELSSNLPGKLKKVESKSSSTVPFLRANFANQDLSDTVYVTANPQLHRLVNGIYDSEPMNVSLHAQIEVWQEQWDDELGTVPPGAVTSAAIQAANEYPDKRIVVHYLQPHAPYIGEAAEGIPSEYLNFWTSFRRGKFDISLETARRAYKENVELALNQVSKLLENFEGKAVVTSDHGELLGERDSPIPMKRFGHLPHRNIPELLEVPWLVRDHDNRPNIISEKSEKFRPDGADGEIVRERLTDLGYK